MAEASVLMALICKRAQAELWEAARGRIEVAETDCTEVGFVEKSKAAAWTECDKHEFVGEHIWKYIM